MYIPLGGTDRPVGYCKFHRTCLSQHQLKTKGCLGYECRHLIRYTQHPYWAQREKTKAKRRARKARLEAEYRRATHQDEEGRIG